MSGETRDVMSRKLGPTCGATEGGSEEAEQQERSRDGGATSGSEGHVGRIARESDK